MKGANMSACDSCGQTGCQPTDYAYWRRILGKFYCPACVKRFPDWMKSYK